MTTTSPGRGRPGRPAATTAHALAAVAQRLFLDSGFDATSVDDIAAAAGISRRTFFRYFATKADVLFAESQEELRRFRAALRDAPPSRPCRQVIAEAVVHALHHEPADRAWALQRTQVIRQVPALQAHVYVVLLAEWIQITRDHVQGRHPDRNEFAVATAHAVPAALVAAHTYWLEHPEEPLSDVLSDILDLMLPGEPVT